MVTFFFRRSEFSVDYDCAILMGGEKWTRVLLTFHNAISSSMNFLCFSYSLRIFLSLKSHFTIDFVDSRLIQRNQIVNEREKLIEDSLLITFNRSFIITWISNFKKFLFSKTNLFLCLQKSFEFQRICSISKFWWHLQCACNNLQRD